MRPPHVRRAASHLGQVTAGLTFSQPSLAGPLNRPLPHAQRGSLAQPTRLTADIPASRAAPSSETLGRLGLGNLALVTPLELLKENALQTGVRNNDIGTGTILWRINIGADSFRKFIREGEVLLW